jgi:hypothetical protein
MSTLKLDEEEKTEYTVEEVKALVEKINANPNLPRAIVFSSVVRMLVTFAIIGAGLTIIYYFGWIAGGAFAAILWAINFVVDRSKD